VHTVHVVSGNYWKNIVHFLPGNYTKIKIKWHKFQRKTVAKLLSKNCPSLFSNYGQGITKVEYFCWKLLLELCTVHTMQNYLKKLMTKNTVVGARWCFDY
jgi:hypothetical protein